MIVFYLYLMFSSFSFLCDASSQSFVSIDKAQLNAGRWYLENKKNLTHQDDERFEEYNEKFKKLDVLLEKNDFDRFFRCTLTMMMDEKILEDGGCPSYHKFWKHYKWYCQQKCIIKKPWENKNQYSPEHILHIKKCEQNIDELNNLLGPEKRDEFCHKVELMQKVIDTLLNS